MKTQVKNPRIKKEQIATMLGLISISHPEIKDYLTIAELISKEFNVDCIASDIELHTNASILNEDYELESRRMEYGVRN